MTKPSLRTLALALAAGVSLAACAYDDYGYGGVSVGYGNPGYYDDYYGYYSSNPYWGWYDGYYYPGTGYYVYDSYRRPHRWSDAQRGYWSGRQSYWQGRDDWRRDRRGFRENWRDFRRNQENK